MSMRSLIHHGAVLGGLTERTDTAGMASRKSRSRSSAAERSVGVMAWVSRSPGRSTTGHARASTGVWHLGRTRARSLHVSRIASALGYIEPLSALVSNRLNQV